MQADNINEYNLMIPMIKNRVKMLKNRRNKKIQRINQVTDPGMTLISAAEGLDNPNIKKENTIKIKAYFESIVLPQAKLDVANNKHDYKPVYLVFRNQIVEQLNIVENLIAKLSGKTKGAAATFFDKFGNGALNDDSKFLGEIENLIAMLTSKKLIPTNNDTFEKIRTYLDSETQQMMENFKKICANISKESFQMISSLFSNSTIVKPEEIDLIQQWVKDQLGASKNFESLLNSKDHGFTAQAFHSRCYNKGPTIIFIETTFGKRFGGFANSSWNGSGNYVKDEKCFIFSLDLKEKYLHKPGSSCSMAGFGDRGPHFGGGADFILYNNCNDSNSSSCNPNSTYICGSRTANDIAGSQLFSVKNYEVYSVK